MITNEQIKALDPAMAVMWIVGSAASLSKVQYQTLLIACRNGGYVQIATDVSSSVAAVALLALVRRGYLTHGYVEGVVAGQLSAHARERLAALKALADKKAADA